MKTSARWAAGLIGLTAAFALSACGDDESDPDPTPTPTPTPSPSVTVTPPADGEKFAISCPDPIGDAEVITTEGQWDPAYVVGTNYILDPVAFGEITFTDSKTGETFTDPPETKPGADTTGAIECTFSGDVEDVDEEGNPVKGTVEGTVKAVIR